MPYKSFKVNIYRIEAHNTIRTASVSFSGSIKNALAQQLDGRYKDVRGKKRRLENYREDANCYLLNFVTFEYAGPSRTEPTSETVPIGLNSNESFAHETAMLYDPGTNLAFVESTQSGMRARAIVLYFEEFSNFNEHYLLIPRLDAEAAAKARGYKTIRSVKLRVAIGPVTSADRDEGIGVINSLGVDYGANIVDIEIKVQRGRSRTLSLPKVRQVINSVLGSDGSNNVTRMTVRGREDDDDRIETIDLIQHRENRETMLQVDAQTRKVPHEERWDALLKIRQEFTG